MADKDQLTAPDGSPLVHYATMVTTPTADTTPKVVLISEAELRLVSRLEDGAGNDGKRGSTKEGMIYGEEYHFNVVLKLENKADKSRDYRWQVSYQSPESSQNTKITKQIDYVGYKAWVKIDDPDMCGCELTITAYLDDPEKGYEMKVFVHHRFRWFDRKLIEAQLEGRGKDHWRINQGQSSLCGMAAIYYVMLERDKPAYMKLAKELHRTGHYVTNGNDLQPADSMYEINPNRDKGYQAMAIPEVDWIVLAGTRSALSQSIGESRREDTRSFDIGKPKHSYGYDGIEWFPGKSFNGIGWPSTLIDGIKKYTGGQIVADETLGARELLGGRGSLEILRSLQDKFSAGSHIVLQICADMISDAATSGFGHDLAKATRSHWVVYAGGLIEPDDKNGRVAFKIYTWATDPESGSRFMGWQEDKFFPVQSGMLGAVEVRFGITLKSFSENYYGYIEIK